MAYLAKIELGFLKWINTSTLLVESPAANVVAQTNDISNAVFLTRANTTAYTVVSMIKYDLGSTIQIWACTTAGTSAGSTPTFATDAAVGANVTDGTAVWTCLGVLDEVPAKKVTLYKTTFDQLHRTNGPALVENVGGYNITQAYLHNGLLHRKDGPALVIKNSSDVIVDEQIWIGGRKIDKDAFWLITHLGTNGVTAGLTLTNPYAAFDTDAELIDALETISSRVVTN